MLEFSYLYKLRSPEMKYSPAEYQRRRAAKWRRAFFILLLLASFACFYFYFKGHNAGQEFVGKRAAVQMYFSNLAIAGAGSGGRYQDLEGK
jgi:hypothetical protein